MSNHQDETYTYRAGQKVVLRKAPDEFVVRAQPETLRSRGMSAEKVSASSSKVTVHPNDLEATMNQARFIAPTHHSYTLAETGEEFLITDRIFVSFKQALPADEVDAFAARYSLTRKATYSDRDYLFQLTDHTGMNPVKLVVKLTEEEPLVATAEHDLNRRASTYQLTLPTDPSYPRQWHLHTRLVDAAFDARSSSRCEDAWRVLDGFGSGDVVVAVTDDGCKLDHPDFNGPTKFAGWGYLRSERLITNADVDANPGEMYKPGANHGTSCCGVIAGEVDALLTVGAAPGCRLLPIQWESSGPSLFISDSKLLTVLNYLSDKADVVSNSWGVVPTNTWVPLVVNRVRQLSQTGGRRGRGIVFLWAAGNENCPIQHSGSIDVPYTWGWQVRPDGSGVWVGVRTARQFENNLVGIPGLMHIAALASNAQRSHYSNYGAGIGVCAPTSNVHEYRRLTVTGLGITTTTGAAGSVTERFGGTSSATPLVAGASALTISANPDLTAIEVVAILKQTASKDLRLEGYPRTPPAPYNLDTSWDVSPISPFDRGDFTNTNGPDGTWSPWFGHGRIDAAAAVAEALRRRAGPTAETIRKSSTPALAIPDNQTAGVRDSIQFSETATLASIKVTLDVTHTYVGDLRLTLISPSGKQVVLHDRNGGNADNIQRSFVASTTPALATLAGEALRGDWTLWVQDLAPVDEGTLNRWELEFGIGGGTLAEVQESPGAMIPDNDSHGIERTLTVSQSGPIRNVEVSLDITHTHIGDLTVTLISPAGTPVTLHNRAGGPTDNLLRTYKSSDIEALRSLHGESMQGVWRLRVADLEAVDVGKLNRWSLKIAS